MFGGKNSNTAPALFVDVETGPLAFASSCPLDVVGATQRVNVHTKWGPQTIAKLVYNSNNYGLWQI